MPRVMKIIARALLDPELHLLLFVLGLIALAVFQLGPEPCRAFTRSSTAKGSRGSWNAGSKAKTSSA